MLTVGDKRISSVRVPKGWTATLYRQPGFPGACRAWGWVRAGASRGASLGVGEAEMGKFGVPTQRAGNDKWRPANL